MSIPALVNAEDQIKAIRDRGVLRVGLAESLPFQFKNPKTNQWDGYNIEMAQDLAKILGVELKLVDAQWSTIIPGLMTGKWDICMVDMYATPKRAMTVVFTDAYFTGGWKVIANNRKNFKTWEEVNNPGNTVVVISGTGDEQVAREFFDKAEVRALVTDNVNSTFLEVASGRADAVITDELNIRIYISRNPKAPVKILQPERTMSPTGYAYAIQPGDYHFLNFLNTWISSLNSGGKAKQMRNKWIENFEFPK